LKKRSWLEQRIKASRGKGWCRYGLSFASGKHCHIDHIKLTWIQS
jgi:hypothetical protein